MEWLDSHVAIGGWKARDDVEASAQVVRSVGWLARDDDVKLIIPHVIEEQGAVIGQGCGEMLIPTRSVVSMVEVRGARSPPSSD